MATGEFSLEEAKRIFIEVLDIVAEQKAEKILCDGREVKGEPEKFERFLYGKFAAETVERYIIEQGFPVHSLHMFFTSQSLTRRGPAKPSQ